MLTDAEATAFADTGNTVEDFVPVRSVKNRNIANSLFKFIPRHLEISRSIFAKYLLQPIKVAESEPYLLFNIADKLARYGQLRRYLGWIFIEHHLTIYPSYNEVSALSRRAYLSFAHYTVSFYNIENSLIKIRIYFNANGKVICNQAKIFVERFKPGVEIQLMPEALSVVRHTAQHAQHALRAFIYARDVAYKQAMTHANALLKDLDAESATLTNKAKYIQNARNFIDVIDKINSEYAESTLDLRGKAVEEILHAIESCSIDRMSQSSQIVVTARVEQDAAVIDARENTTITGTVSETAIDTVREAATQAQLIVEN